MQKGDVVTIYHDPLTRTRTEGTARLIEKFDDGGEPAIYEGKEVQRWHVRFTDDPPGVYEARNILAD